MKSNYQINVNRSDLRKQLEAKTEEMVRRYEATIRAETEESVARQMLAVIFAALHRKFGFGKKRLKRLQNAADDEFALIHTAPLGQKYTALDVEQWLKDKYQIDFTETRYTADGWGASKENGHDSGT